MKIWIELGTVILNTLVRSKMPEGTRDTFTDIITMLKDFGIGEFEARNINRDFEKIEDNIAISCSGILQHSNLSPERIEAIVRNINFAYEKAEITIDKFLDLGAKANEIKNILLESNSKYKDDLDPREAEMYERLVEHTSHLIENAFIKLPSFNQIGIKRLSAKMDELVEKVDIILEQMARINTAVEDKNIKTSNFERCYRNNIISQNSYVYLFGAGDLSSEYKRYPLSIAYVELEISDKTTGREIKLEKIFEKTNNIWMSGEAGLGKTTLLQWIAVKVAEKSEKMYGLRDCIPVMIHLRKCDCTKLSLKDCINSVMKDSSYTIPEGWVDELREMGRFVFLIDGFDEISENERQEVLDWLNQMDDKNKCKKIFTSRPQVKERPVGNKVLEVKILPMDRIRIKKFIKYWHRAVLEEQLKVDKKDTISITNELYEKIGMSDALLKLSSVPLLCAMICALHYRNAMHLPTNKRELYEECCKMLLEKRDEERNIIQKRLNLSYEQKKIILAKLAYWMMKNNHVQISVEDAEKAIKRAIAGMNIHSDEKVVFKYLFERCGILREPEKYKVDFLHRTFQEYLAAYEIQREEDWGLLKEKIGNTVWQETIGICLGFAKKSIATDILEETLKKGTELCEEKKYLFTAIEYLNGAIEVEEDTRKRIEYDVAELIPPESYECVELAKAGELVVPYLKNDLEYSQEDRVACLQVLRHIGTMKALEVSKTYLNQVLSKSELLELGKLYQQFTKRDLIEIGIPITIKNYIETLCKTTVTLHNEMINMLRWLKAEELKCTLSIKNLEIIEYDDDTFANKANIFKNVTSLILEGNFDDLSILNCTKNLTELSLYNLNDEFLIYKLNEYPALYDLENFSLVTFAQEYITGRDLHFLTKCQSLQIILLNNLSEMYFEQFDELCNIRDLTIGAEFALELDYSCLPETIENLTIVFPKKEVSNNQYRDYIYSDIKNVYFEDLEEYTETYTWWSE